MQWIKDREHLRLLSIGHYVVGGLAIFFSSIFIFHVIFGAALLTNPRWLNPTPVPVSTPAAPSNETATDEANPSPTPVSVPSRRRAAHGDQPPAFLGYMLVAVGSVAVLLGWTIGALLIYSGRCLARRTRRVFSMVVAGVSCLQVPLGTILGVFTLVVLQRPTVQALYAAEGPR